jgi:hypothetical protein
MFGSEVTTDWKPGSPITWKGEFEGRAYEDKGEVIAVEPGRRLRSPTSARSPARRTTRELPPGALRATADQWWHVGTADAGYSGSAEEPSTPEPTGR